MIKSSATGEMIEARLDDDIHYNCIGDPCDTVRFKVVATGKTNGNPWLENDLGLRFHQCHCTLLHRPFEPLDVVFEKGEVMPIELCAITAGEANESPWFFMHVNESWRDAKEET